MGLPNLADAGSYQYPYSYAYVMRTFLLILSLLILVGSVSASSPSYYMTLTNGLYGPAPFAYWRLDEASGNLVDNIGSIACVPSGGLTYSQTGALLDGSGNPALLFNGSSGYCSTASPVIGGFYPATALGQGWSLEVWFKPASLGGSQEFIASLGANVFPDIRYAWGLLYDDATKRVAFHVFGGGTSGDSCVDNDHAVILTNGGVLTVGVWTHIVVTMVGKGPYSCGGDTCHGVKDMKIYINGVLDNDVGIYDYTDLFHQECLRNDLKLQIGRLEFLPTELANGTIDELSIYSNGTADSALTATQVYCHYAAGIGQPCSEQLDWPFTASIGERHGSKNPAS